MLLTPDLNWEGRRLPGRRTEWLAKNPCCTHYPNPFLTARFPLTPILKRETLSLYALDH